MEPEPLDTSELARAGAGLLTLLLAMMVITWIVFDAAGLSPAEPDLEERIKEAPTVLFTAFFLSGLATGAFAYGFSSGPLRFLLGSSSELGWRGAVGGALATLLTGQSVFFLVGAVGDPGGENQELLSAGLLSPSPLLATLALTSVILVNPLGEELFYRGFLLDCLNRVFGSGFAIVLSATLYGLMQFDPVQSFAATMMGVVLGVLALGGASLRPAIFANVFFNLVLVLLHRFAPAGFAAPELVLGPLENLLAAVVTGALAVFCLVFAVGRPRLAEIFSRAPAPYA